MSEAIKKRKASTKPDSHGGVGETLAGSMDFATATASEIADYFVSLVPVMKDDETTDKVVKALESARLKILVRDYREHAKQQQVASDMEVASVSFCNVSLPKEAVHRILDYLPQYDLCEGVALSCKSLLVASRAPSLWSRSVILYRSSLRYNWWKLFIRPQFASLKSTKYSPKFSQEARWKLPSSKQALELLSLCCPQLEELYLEGEELIISHDEIEDFPTLFPNLTSLLIWNCRNEHDIEKICSGLGGNLLKLTVVNHIIDSDYGREEDFCDATLARITKSCPNLQEFVWDIEEEPYEPSNIGIKALLEGCPHLRRLAVFGHSGISLEAFETFPAHGSSLVYLQATYSARDNMTEEDEEILTLLRDRIRKCYLKTRDEARRYELSRERRYNRDQRRDWTGEDGFGRKLEVVGSDTSFCSFD